MIGVFHFTRDGFGYVEVSDSNGLHCIPTVITYRDGIFDGDTVDIIVPSDFVQKTIGKNKNARVPIHGKIFRAVKHKQDFVTGVLRYIDGKAYVFPDSYLPFKVQVKPGSAGLSCYKDGEKVAGEFMKFKSVSALRLNLIDSFGKNDTLSANIRAAVYRIHAFTDFPPEALKEAYSLSFPDVDAYISKRLDLRSKPIFTVSHSFTERNDSALSLEKSGNNIIVGVHVADVPEAIAPGSVLDLEARKRGKHAFQAVYPGALLPNELVSERFCFHRNHSKLAVSVFVTFAPDGSVVEVSFAESVIKATLNATYGDIDAIISSADHSATLGLRERYGSIISQVELLYQVAARLKAARLNRGGLDHDPNYLIFDVDDDFSVNAIASTPCNDSLLTINELLVGVGCAVAEKLCKEQKQCLFAGCDETKFSSFMDIPFCLEGFSSVYSLDAPGYIPAISAEARRLNQERFIFPIIDFIMPYPRFSTHPINHFMNAADKYCRFSSPISRYSDILMLRVIKAYLHGTTVENLDELAAETSALENEVYKVERKLQYYLFEAYLTQHIEKQFSATVVSHFNDNTLVYLDCGIHGFVKDSLLESQPGCRVVLSPCSPVLVNERLMFTI